MTHGTILLVDDEVKIRRALGSALRDEGHEVVEAGGALEAQRLLAQQPFDVLVIDNRMPEMSGLDLIRELSSSVEVGERPQILMMTAHATIEGRHRSHETGSLRLLAKAV